VLLILDHLTGDPYLLVTKVAELGLLGALVILLRSAAGSSGDGP